MNEEADLEITKFLSHMQASLLVPPKCKGLIHIVKEFADWEEVKERFVGDVKRFRTMSFDTETYWQTTSMVFVLSGALTGRVVIFDLRAIQKTTRKFTLNANLPEEFRSILKK